LRHIGLLLVTDMHPRARAHTHTHTHKVDKHRYDLLPTLNNLECQLRMLQASVASQ